jgi:hypothetical protein
VIAPLLAVCLLAEPPSLDEGTSVARSTPVAPEEPETVDPEEERRTTEPEDPSTVDPEEEPEPEPEPEAAPEPELEGDPEPESASPVPPEGAPSMVETETRPRRGPGSRTPGPRWTRWGAPLLSALIPGAGQAINRQPGKAVSVFGGAFALVGGAVGVALSRDRATGASPGRGDGDALQITRLGALSALTSAAGLLYVGQILDAYAVAVGKWPRPHRDYAVNLEVTRMSTVGMRPGEPRYALYDDFSIALMGQVAPKVAFGLADLSVKFIGSDFALADRTTLQGGIRTTWRFFERDRWWLLLGGGFIFQGTGAGDPNPSLDPEAPRPNPERRFGAVGYVQMEARWFLLDRWSLNLAPRVSVPIADRAYEVGTIPRYATTFELGTGVGVYF